MIASLLQKRIRLDFNESDTEEIAELLANTPTCPITAVGGPLWLGMPGLGTLSPWTPKLGWLL